jgi:hypothetical protein
MAKLIGNEPNQVPTNGDLGKLAFQEPEAVNITGGSVKVDVLGINDDPTASASTASTHKIAIDLNGTTYYILLTDS